MRRWQAAQVGSLRCASSCCRTDADAPAFASSRFATPGGGSGGGAPSRFSRIHLPRSTGEVRVAYEDTVSTLACVRTPPRAGRHVNSLEVGSADAVYAVMPRQALVQERVRRAEEVEDAAVLADDALEEQLGLPTHREAQVVVEPREPVLVGRRRLQRADLQPLPAELLDQRARPCRPAACAAPRARAPRASAARPGRRAGADPRRACSPRGNTTGARASSCVADRRARRGGGGSTRVASARGLSPLGRSDDACAPRAGPARCGTGSPARPASPGSLRRALPRSVRPGAGPAPPGRCTWRPPPASTGRRKARRAISATIRRRHAGAWAPVRWPHTKMRARLSGAGAVACAYGPPISIAATRASFAGTLSACCSVELLAQPFELLGGGVGRRREHGSGCWPGGGIWTAVGRRQPFEQPRHGCGHPVLARRHPDPHVDELAAEVLLVGEERSACLGIERPGLHLPPVNPEGELDWVRTPPGVCRRSRRGTCTHRRPESDTACGRRSAGSGP